MFDYAHPESLVTTQWVSDHLNDPNVRLLEVAWDTSEFESGHIPNAVAGWVFNDIQQGDSRTLPSKVQIENKLSEAEITNNDTVVVYGGFGNLIAVMTFWLLKLYGHRDVRLLDGGRQKWIAENRPLSKELPTIKPAQYVAQSPNMNLRADREFIMGLLGQNDYILVDARPEDMYTGENSAGIMHGGHIPSAINVPAERVLDTRGEFVGWQTPTTNSDGTFKSAEELRALFAEKGISKHQHIVTYCLRGGLSTHMWFVLTQLLGYSNVREYDLSWAEWGNLENMPVEK